MNQPSLAMEQILQALSDSPDRPVEELVSACPGLTWNQVFLAVDRLSRTGQVQLTRVSVGTYTVQLSTRTHESFGGIPPAGDTPVVTLHTHGG